MSAKEEFELEPNGMFIAKMLAMIVVILQADFGEFAGVKGYVWTDARALTAEDILGIESAFVSINPFAAKAGNPSWLETPEQLRIKAPVAQSFCRKSRCDVFTGLKAFIKRLGLP